MPPAAPAEYIEYLRELFASFGLVEARRMFGGWGIYHQGLMFALVVDETLYLKADAELAARFAAQGLPPFRYTRRGRSVALSFYLAPAALYDDPDEARQWGRLAYAAALRAASRERPRAGATTPAGSRARRRRG